MSAIVGIYCLDKDLVPLEHSNSLMESLTRFPSDERAIWHEHQIFMGCHAQWITPESIEEKLPYYDAEKKLAITADAIIDNREELFQILNIPKEKNCLPDSLLILLAYAKWGEDTPKYLQGDFAFMIWDEKEEKLFGARDFSGTRTLYYYHDYRRFTFSTIIEPLFTLPYIKKQINEEWLAEFLAIPSMVEAVDMGSTVYKGISQLPPSHSITVHDGRVKLKRYFTMEVKEKLKLGSNEEYEEAFRDVLGKAIKVRLRTNGNVGSHLSGGLDSGSVVSLASKELRKQDKVLHTFSYVPLESFQDWTPYYYVADEGPLIKEIVNYVGNIKDNCLRFPDKSPLNDVEEFLEIMEMPYKFFENSFWLKGISEVASKKGIKVLLNGARGNHSISWGSLNLTYTYYMELMKKLRWISLNRELNNYCTNYHTGKRVVVPFLVNKIMKSKQQQPYQDQPIINPSFAEKTNVYEKMEVYGFRDISKPTNLNDYRNLYYKQLYVWNKSGVAGTKLSLRYGLWDRDPTNDINVIRFCLSIPKEQYVTSGMDRSIIRRAMKGYLPDKVRLNHKTRGLQGADVVQRMSSDWGSYLSEIQEMLDSKILEDYVDYGVIRMAFNKVRNGPEPELLFSDDFKILNRCLIVQRFLKSI
ncbi:asparagine synthase-related protein [Ornithinibacillus californiensis]|uniref:asparagine synthase-related protein n=1 Tax=Ornithinibacillus californiensis TaxID=161536 RepID=UPI00064DCAC3|nr:asparagine synthase-related protein [Ornithinibacillus californiensis]